MKIDAQTRMAFPREVAFRTYRDRLPELIPHLPNVASIEVRERRDEDARTHLVNLWTATGAEIPAAARRFVKPEYFSFTDFAEWDESAWTCRWRIETHALPGVVECSGHNEFVVDGDHTLLRIVGELVVHPEKAKVPRLLAGTVRPLLEKLIVGAITPNLTSVGGGVERFLREQASA